MKKKLKKIPFSFSCSGNGNNSNTCYYLCKQKDVVDNGYGFNYIQSAINKSTSSVTKYSVNEQNTPYKVSESID